MDVDDQTGHSDKHVMCLGVGLSSFAGDMMVTRKPTNGKQARGRNEGPEAVFRPEGQVSNAETINVAPTGRPLPEVAEWKAES